VKVPLLYGTRVAVVDAADEDIVLIPPAPAEAIDDVGAAVRDALRFPLAGEPLEALVTPGGRATIVIEPPALPIPTSATDPRAAAIAATVAELVRLGVASERQTLFVAGGLARRTAQRELEALVPPDLARRFHGRVEVHDAEGDELVPVDGVRVHRALLETDLVVCVTAAETVLAGGPAALLAGADPTALRAAHAESLLEPRTSSGWAAAVALERVLARRMPVVGVSLAVNHPHFSGPVHGYPYDPEALERVASSPLRPVFGLLPASVRARVFRSLRAEASAAAVYAGPPSVAHAEALLRAVDLRGRRLEAPLDAVCIGVPRLTPYLPRERPNPLLAAFLAFGLALRLWRDSPPLAEDGTVILVHRFHRHFSHPTQQPYRAFFAAARFGRESAELQPAEEAAARDERAIEQYRAGRTCHPLLPFADWDACAPALERAGSVLVAGCRDAVAARQLGFVPVHGIGPALAMARARGGGSARIGFLVAPPYFPLIVAS
jgi:Lactate racemase N-terminal domain